MLKKTKVTVITGYYNREWCVLDSMASLLNQTYDDYKIIAFDDCSKDKTFELLSSLESDKFHAVRFSENTGFVNGMIKMIKEYAADSEYILVHGSGDIALPTLIEKEVRILDQLADTVIASCQFTNIDPVSGQQQIVRSKEVITNAELQVRNLITHGGTMFRKATYDQVNGYSKVFKFAQDYDLWLKLTKHGLVRVVPEILYERMANLDGVSVQPAKFIEQCMYTELASQFNTMSDEEILRISEEVEKSGVASVQQMNKRINKKILQHFHSAILKGHKFDLQSFTRFSKNPFTFYYKLLFALNEFKLFHKMATNTYKLKKKIRVN